MKSIRSLFTFFAIFAAAAFAPAASTVYVDNTTSLTLTAPTASIKVSSGNAITLLTGSTFNASAGTLTLADNQIAQTKINGLSTSLAGLQPLDSDLTSYANAANAAARRTLIGSAALNGSESETFSAQSFNSDAYRRADGLPFLEYVGGLMQFATGRVSGDNLVGTATGLAVQNAFFSGSADANTFFGANWGFPDFDASALYGTAASLTVGAAGTSERVQNSTGQAAFTIDGISYYPHVTGGVLTFTDTP